MLNSLFTQQRAEREGYSGRCRVAYCDIVKEPLPMIEQVDFASLIFVLSAVAPEHHRVVAERVYQVVR